MTLARSVAGMPGASSPATSNNQTALLWLLGSVACATVMTGLVRLLSGEIPTPMLAFLRSCFGLLLVLPFFVGEKRRASIRVTAWRLHLWRGLLIIVALNAGFHAIANLPLATATVLFFTAPVFTTVLAGPILGERVGPRRWSAVLAGFVGALIILRPDTGVLDPTMVIALISSAAFAMVLLLGKQAAAIDTPDAVFVSSNIIVGIGALGPALFFWTWPGELTLWLLVLALGLSSNLRAYADIRAYALGEAGFLAPFTYLRLISIGLVGYLVFGEILDAGTLVGGAVIVAATIYIAVREAQLKRERRASQAPSAGSPDV